MASLFPMRCFTCGKLIANKWNTFEELFTSNSSSNSDLNAVKSEALDSMKISRICCRRMFLTHVPQLEKVLLKYPVEKGYL